MMSTEHHSGEILHASASEAVKTRPTTGVLDLRVANLVNQVLRFRYPFGPWMELDPFMRERAICGREARGR